jgi:uncharacterized membrane-anchored protein YitT (DUF2179 family)
MQSILKKYGWIMATIFGSAVFALGFSLFLEPNDINSGGISGLAQTVGQIAGIRNIGLLSVALNIPLFVLGGVRIGKRFFAGSLMGMITSGVLIDVFSAISIEFQDSLVCGIYGGLLCGLGIGVVFAAGASTGGSDILVRLLKLRYRNVPIGTISITFDAFVVILTGIVFHDISRALYSGIAVFITGQVMDIVVYRFDYSKVAVIISDCADEIAADVAQKLDRGVTFLSGQGFYSRQDKKVILTVVKRGQLSELKELVMERDAAAFVIVQEAHQVLGDGFSHYSKDSL